jgi:hypothetical protein
MIFLFFLFFCLFLFLFLSSITVNYKLENLFVPNEGKNYIYVLKY